MAAPTLGRNLGQLIVRTRNYLKEPDENKSHWKNVFLRQVLNSQYRLRSTELHLAREGHFLNVAFRDLEANKARYEFPPGFTRLGRLELVRSDGRLVPLTRYERRFETMPTTGSSGDGYYPIYRLLSGGFVLEPKPTETIVNGLRMEYDGIPVEITDDNDELSPEFPEMFDELLVLDTVVGLLHAEELQEGGLQRTFMTWKESWESRWLRYIDSRSDAQQRVVPFIPGSPDA